MVHPELGSITLDCDVLTVAGTDIRIVVYTAEPFSPDAENSILCESSASSGSGQSLRRNAQASPPNRKARLEVDQEASGPIGIGVRGPTRPARMPRTVTLWPADTS